MRKPRQSDLNEEWVEHLLLSCDWSRAIWFDSNFQWCINIHEVIRFDKITFLKQNSSHSQEMVALILNIYWWIWKARNKFCVHLRKGKAEASAMKDALLLGLSLNLSKVYFKSEHSELIVGCRKKSLLEYCFDYAGHSGIVKKVRWSFVPVGSKKL